MKPIFFGQSLRIGNPNSNVGICTCWTEREKILKDLPKDSYALCGNLYSKEGIEYLAKNILANPIIRYLILVGNDLKKVVKVDNFFGEFAEKLKGVEVIDLRGKEDRLVEVIKGLEKKGPFGKPIFLREEIIVDKMETAKVGFTVRERTISRNWLTILDLIMKWGVEKETEYGSKQKEILNLISVIEGDEEVVDFLPFTKEELEKYLPTMMEGKGIAGTAYTYGERLWNYLGKINQVREVVKQLEAKNYTRRAVACLWNVEMDIGSKHPPCLTQISWNVRKGRLYQTCFIRSNDMYGAWPLNVYGLRELQKKIAREVGLECGSLVTISHSAHIYEFDWEKAERVIAKKEESGFEEDELGYFVINLEKGMIKVRHYVEGKKTKYVFSGGAKEIYKKIIRMNLVSRLDHAAYLGYELMRAEEALKGKRKYIQDA